MRFVSWCLLVLAVAACGDVLDSPDDPAPPVPAILAVAPPRGIVTTAVTITGTAFGDARGTVTIGDQPATVESWSDSSIVIEIPDLYPGEVPVVVTTAKGASEPASLRVTLPPRAYLNNNTPLMPDTSDRITVMSFDPATGALVELVVIPMGLPPASYSGCMTNVVVHDGTRRLFAGGSTGVAVFDIHPTTGMLTAVPGSPFLGIPGYGIEVDNAGRRLWRAGTDGIYALGIAETGALFPIAGSPFAVTPYPVQLVASHDERHLYTNTASNVGNELLAFNLADNGAVTRLAGGPFPSGYSFSLSQHPTRDQLVVATTQMVEVWEPAGATGLPAQITGSPFATAVPPGEGLLHHTVFTADGSRAYVGTFDGPYLMGFDVAPSGALTPLARAPWNLAASKVTNMMCSAAARDTNHLIVAPSAEKVVVFELAADGTPTQVTGSPFGYKTFADVSGLAITF